ncbi:MAG: elongation factor G [Methylothermaceae bacteria B42]|nr:MAG: elongation factor G [Methylothermaceae bacteria B42]HHJ40360.1 elongation factor G [Methylothermaceae bacterium]
MSDYSTEDIRNIAFIGHAGSGKTELIETLLAASGMIPQKGSNGSRVCDFDPLEKQLGHSLEPSLYFLNHLNTRINLLDTPGFPDFLGRTLSVLPAVDTVALVVDAVTGSSTLDQKLMEVAAQRKLCRLIIINKIDSPEADPNGILQALQEAFGNECLPLNLPADQGKSVVDCFFQPDGKPTDFSSVEQAHSDLVDQVVEVDEALMEIYLEQGQELQPEQLHDPFEKALRESHLIPVCFVSARTGAGIEQLLQVMAKLMPNPKEGNPPQFYKGEGEQAEPVTVSPEIDAHAIAHVFKINVDPFIGKLGIFRVHQGSIGKDSQLFIGDGRKPFKVSHLYQLQGKQQFEIDRGVPGDLCAVAKVEAIHYDAVLHDSHDEDFFHLEPIQLPTPMVGVAVQPVRRGDEQKLSDALHKLVAEDPSAKVEHDPEANETVLWGLGGLHLRVLLERMKSRFNLEVETHPPSIPYRETISRPAEGHHRHKKQTGGAGQFGEVFLKIEPLPRGAGFEFVNQVVGGAIPSQFIPAVEKGVRQAMAEGFVAQFPMQDIRVIVYDGKHHPVDSKEVAFVAAGKKAFFDAVEKAQAIILEPIMQIIITAPNASMGDITGDIASRRGRINSSNALANGWVEINALAPLSELQDYESTLKSITGGEGSFTMTFSHYDPLPPQIQKKLAEERRKEKE